MRPAHKKNRRYKDKRLPNGRGRKFASCLPAFFAMAWAGFFILMHPWTGPAHGKEPGLEPVVLQLKWKHQFQFAGFYAAIEKGYYREQGLDVILKEGVPGVNNTDEVVQRRADYGVDMPVILLERNKGKPVVALAAIFQHSPEVLIARKDTKIHTPHDMIGKKIMLRPRGHASIRAMFKSEGIQENQLEIIDHTWNIEDLINGKADVSGAYITDFPFAMKEKKVPYSVISPLIYGIDFYGDCIFTAQGKIKENPDQVKAFLGASIKGWGYAMAHQEELVDIILKKYNPELSRQALLYEAEATYKLIQPKFIEIGHMNPGRWKHIGDTLVDLNMLPPDYSLKDFIYSPGSRPDNTAMLKIIWALSAAAVLIGLISVFLLLFNRRLNRKVTQRTAHLSLEITERQKAEKDLKASESFLNSIIENIPNMIFIKDARELRFLRLNRAGEELLGYSRKELLGKNDYDFFPEKEADFFTGKDREVLKSGSIVEIPEESVLTRHRGERLLRTKKIAIPDEDGKYQYLLGISEDITDLKQMEEQLRQAQKMESVGRLAGGVAHDFNNMLSIILGRTEMMIKDLPKDSPTAAKLREVRMAAKRSADLTRQLLAFARKQDIAPRTLNLNRAIEDLLKIIQRLIGEDTELDWQPHGELWPVRVDPSQLDQILANLCINARDAIADVGSITIETNNASFDEAYCLDHRGFVPGEYVMIAVSDTGCGMDKKVLKNLFEPFFTTKEMGEGTGLGLATVYGIVKQNQGFINVYSEPGKGTTFRVYLPRHEKSSPGPGEESENKAPRGGMETLLLVEDEKEILAMTKEMLQSLGYNVLTASSPAEAIKIRSSYPNRVDLLLTDVIMPGMNGRELAEKMTLRFPHLKTLFMSGYTANILKLRGGIDQGMEFIAKPFNIRDISLKIRAILDNSQK